MTGKTRFWSCLPFIFFPFLNTIQADPITVNYSGVLSDMPVFQQGDPSNPLSFSPGSLLELAPDIRYVLVSGYGWKLIPSVLFPVMEANSFTAQVTYDEAQDVVVGYHIDIAGITLTENDVSLGHWSGKDIEFKFSGETIGRGELLSSSQVPEPSSVVLLTSGIVALTMRSRRRKNRDAGS